MRSKYLPFGVPNISKKEIDAVARVMRSGWIGMGPETVSFELEIAEYLEVPNLVIVNSCTSALFLSLIINEVGPGTEVICPSFTWCSTANAIKHLGAIPVFCDVDPDTLCISIETIHDLVTNRTKAIIPVHIGGLAMDVDKLRSVLPESVAIVEDAAHAFGSAFADGSLVGASGNLTCFSFYANKNLSTAEGGAIALFDSVVADRLRKLRQNGYSVNAWESLSNYKTPLLSDTLSELGYKMSYTDLQAAMGRVQLSRQEEFAKRRMAVAKRYAKRLYDLDPEIRIQRGFCDESHARHMCLVALPVEKLKLDRSEIVLELRKRNIGASLHYTPLHKMPLYSNSINKYDLHVTEDLARRVISLPISASMTALDACDVVDAIADIYDIAYCG